LAESENELQREMTFDVGCVTCGWVANGLYSYAVWTAQIK